jgi:hypothetical protein
MLIALVMADLSAARPESGGLINLVAILILSAIGSQDFGGTSPCIPLRTRPPTPTTPSPASAPPRPEPTPEPEPTPPRTPLNNLDPADGLVAG